MKIMKKAISLALASSMVVSMAACGQSKDNASGESAEGDVITLRILENDTAKQEGYLDELINAFNEAYKGKGIQAVFC